VAAGDRRPPQQPDVAGHEEGDGPLCASGGRSPVPKATISGVPYRAARIRRCRVPQRRHVGRREDGNRESPAPDQHRRAGREQHVAARSDRLGLMNRPPRRSPRPAAMPTSKGHEGIDCPPAGLARRGDFPWPEPARPSSSRPYVWICPWSSSPTATTAYSVRSSRRQVNAHDGCRPRAAYDRRPATLAAGGRIRAGTVRR